MQVFLWRHQGFEHSIDRFGRDSSATRRGICRRYFIDFTPAPGAMTFEHSRYCKRARARAKIRARKYPGSKSRTRKDKPTER